MKKTEFKFDLGTLTIIISICIILTFAILFHFGYRFIPSNSTNIDYQELNTVLSWVIPSVLSMTSIMIAIEVPKKIAEQQNKIALFDKRQKFFDEIINYIEYVINNRGFIDSGVGDIFLKYSNLYISAIFDKDVETGIDPLKNKVEKIIDLSGDYDHADRKGDCRGKSCDEILSEIDDACNDLVIHLNSFKENIVLRYIKL